MGNLFSIIAESFPPQPIFTVDDIPDLSGQIIIVTGGNTGIGKETVKELLNHDAKVYLAARNQEKAFAAIKELSEVTGKEAIFLKLDLSDLKGIKAAAEEFLSKETQLHVLFNNAGVMVPPVEQLTADGYDLQFGTNVLGHFYFTKLLLPTLIATAKTSSDGKARVVNTSSLGHIFNGVNFNTLKDSPTRRRTLTQVLYHQSKRGNVIYATELARRYGDQGIVSTSLNPGNISTDLQRHAGVVTRLITEIITYQPKYGALTQLWAGTAPWGATMNGKYLRPWARLGYPHPDSQDPELGKQLWTWLEEQVENV